MNRKPHLNYKHLRYFMEIARHGSVGGAAKVLFVAPQTVSAQLLELEAQIGQPLFERAGRRLVLTQAGEVAREYATSIFALGDELAAVLAGQHSARRLTLRIGITDSVPKLMSVDVIEPVLVKHRERIEFICHENNFNTLLGQLLAHEVDAVLADTPVPASLNRSLHGKLLMNSGISFLANAKLAQKLGKRFPGNLHDAPLLHTDSTSSTMAQALDIWLARQSLTPQITGRFDDSALMKGFASRGLGVVTVPASIEKLVCKQYGLQVIGRTDEVQQPLFLIRARRERTHPIITEIEQRFDR